MCAQGLNGLLIKYCMHSPSKTRRSWFGWNRVNESEELDDVGPNETKDVPR